MTQGSRENYPSSTEIESQQHNLDYIPESLKVLLKNTLAKSCSDIVVCSIGQAVMQNTRPRTILASLQLGLGVQMHRQFGSKFLIDSLHKQGFCVSYDEGGSNLWKKCCVTWSWYAWVNE